MSVDLPAGLSGGDRPFAARERAAAHGARHTLSIISGEDHFFFPSRGRSSSNLRSSSLTRTASKSSGNELAISVSPFGSDRCGEFTERVRFGKAGRGE